MTARAVSASTRSPNPVDPPRSQNIAVTVLRTAAGGGAAASVVPQPSQKRAVAVTSRAHCGQCRANGDPQSAQNDASGRFSAPQPSHATARPPPSLAGRA